LGIRLVIAKASGQVPVKKSLSLGVGFLQLRSSFIRVAKFQRSQAFFFTGILPQAASLERAALRQIIVYNS
jgi:hypothetical protein